MATSQIITDHWTLPGQPIFDNEILQAHGKNKRSYHVLVKAYDDKGNIVLIKNFQTCKTIAKMVNDILGCKIEVIRKPGHGGLLHQQATTSFIDLRIYSRDRLLRLALSSKITDPARPFRPLKDGKSYNESTLVLETLVVPMHSNAIIGCAVIDVDSRDVNSKITKMDQVVTKSMTPFYHRKVLTTIPDPLMQWVQQLASTLPESKKIGNVVRECRYDKMETSLNFTISRDYASYCYCINRAHRSQNIMITINLSTQCAYQRCWDINCKGKNGYKYSHFLSSSPPPGVFPIQEYR